MLQPLMTMLVFSLFFGKLAKMPSAGLPYPIFYLCALLPWLYFANAMQSATNVVVEQQKVITKVYFPRLALPISAVISPLLDFAIGFAFLLLMMAYYHLHPTVAVLLLPTLPDLRNLYGSRRWSMALALNAIYRDVRYVVPFLIQFWMFASPVAYPSSLVPERWRWLYGLNPMAGAIEAFRWALTGHGNPPNILIAASAFAVLVLVGSGAFYFQKMEGVIADVV